MKDTNVHGQRSTSRFTFCFIYLAYVNASNTTTSASSASSIDKMEYKETEEGHDGDVGAVNQLKRIELDVDEKTNVAQDDNELVDTESQPESLEMAIDSAKIDNLELFPVEVLQKIFIRMDDAGLLNLAETCTRFVAIAQMVFSMRYADQYYTVNDDRTGGDPDIYASQFNYFGSSIKAIQLNHIEDIDSTHWALNLFQPHTSHIEKLTFNNCIIKSKNVFAQPLDDLTHLIYRNGFIFYETGYREEIEFPECRKLQKLEVHQNVYYQKFSPISLYRTIRNNPSLQSLLLYNFPVNDMRFWEIMTLIADNLNQIKELALVMDSDWKWEPASQTIDTIFKSFEHLKWLDISVGPNSFEQLTLFGTMCKQIKHLGLLVHGSTWYGYNRTNVLVDIARSFHQIEKFHFYEHAYYDIEAKTEAMVEELSELREISLNVTNIRLPNVLRLFHKCPTLEKVTIDYKYNCDEYPKTFFSVKFFERFIETTNITGKPKAQIEVTERGQVIGSVTANGTVWRNKLMHWIDCDRNDTNINLLDLAKHPVGSEKMKRAADQTNLFDRICEYLDMCTLTALVNTGERSEQLVNSYVKKQSKQFGTFILTDEFRPFRYDHFWIHLNEFDHITNLKIYAMHSVSKCLVFINFGCIGRFVDKLSIYDEYPHVHWNERNLPSSLRKISYIVYDSSHFVGYSKLTHIIQQFPGAKTIEFKKAGLFNDFKPGKSQSPKCHNLKEFVFNYRGKTQMANLKEIFKNTNTKLVPIYPKSA